MNASRVSIEAGEPLERILNACRKPLFVYWDADEDRNIFTMDAFGCPPSPLSLVGHVPPIYPEWLGDRAFLDVHRVRFPYVCGEMARGIASVEMVRAAARAGFLGFFGAAGLSRDAVSSAIDELRDDPGPDRAWGVNLIHSPGDPGAEEALVDLFLERDVRRVSASAFLRLSLAVVRYMATGLRHDDEGRIVRRNHVFAKLSRPEMASLFMSPPPADMLRDLSAAGKLTREEVRLAAEIPVAEDIVAEADSGGHTDNRPLTVLLPVLRRLRETLATKFPACADVRIGAAGGLGDPSAIASAFALGAAFVTTGSINQASIESGLSPRGKLMLASAGMADMTMAPSADMFEMGVEVQVLRKGTLFAQRAARLHEIYSSYDSIESIPRAIAQAVERDIFQRPLAQVWEETAEFFRRREPESRRVDPSPKAKLGLVCRWYLGKASQWAISGDAERQMDFQIWCGPALGAFNAWVKGSFLEPVENRSVTQIGLNLLEGAARITRAHQLRAMGVSLPGAAFEFTPRPLA